MFKSLHELSRQGASGTSSHRGFRSLFLPLTALLLCSTVSLAATDWQARMAQCSAAAVQAAAQEAPEGLTLSQEELALYRLGFAQGFDAGQAAASAPVAEPSSSDEPMVWIPVHGGTKYHANATCSNMKSPMEVALSVALEKGYEPCKRCHPPTE